MRRSRAGDAISLPKDVPLARIGRWAPGYSKALRDLLGVGHSTALIFESACEEEAMLLSVCRPGISIHR